MEQPIAAHKDGVVTGLDASVGATVSSGESTAMKSLALSSSVRYRRSEAVRLLIPCLEIFSNTGSMDSWRFSGSTARRGAARGTTWNLGFGCQRTFKLSHQTSSGPMPALGQSR